MLRSARPLLYQLAWQFAAQGLIMSPNHWKEPRLFVDGVMDFTLELFNGSFPSTTVQTKRMS